MADPYGQQPQPPPYLYQQLQPASSGSDTMDGQPSNGSGFSRRLPVLPPIYPVMSAAQSDGIPMPLRSLPLDAASLAGETSPISSSPKAVSSGKSFQCTGYEGCSMSFSRSEHLARHVRKHTGEKPFPCRCGKKFTRLDNLRQHASTIHADEAEANEELFTRLAAHMPRSGQRARRQSVQAKSGGPPTASPSPSVLQGSFPAMPQPTSSSPTFPNSATSDAFRYYPASPLSASSATFRVPPSNASPVHTFRAGTYEGYPTQPHSWSSSYPQPPQPIQSPSHSPVSPKRFTNQPTTTLSPVPAPGGGSHFRSYSGSTTILSPTRVESPRSATGSARDVVCYLPSPDPSHAAGSVSNASPRPILPSLSALIADAPALTFPTASFAKHRPNQRAPAPLQALPYAAQLDKALLVAVELAMESPTSSAQTAMDEEERQPSSGRSLSFSSDISGESLGYISTSPVSSAVPSPPPLTADTFSPTCAPVKVPLQRSYLKMHGTHMS